ncbi:hypothetical protein BY458DRAFT_494045 [Sporodiniella umbellata]|nr:hypothetical protein BY458DRAFT_494045 [Sporodiniella umbellata]
MTRDFEFKYSKYHTRPITNSDLSRKTRQPATLDKSEQRPAPSCNLLFLGIILTVSYVEKKSSRLLGVDTSHEAYFNAYLDIGSVQSVFCGIQIKVLNRPMLKVPGIPMVLPLLSLFISITCVFKCICKYKSILLNSYKFFNECSSQSRVELASTKCLFGLDQFCNSEEPLQEENVSSRFCYEYNMQNLRIYFTMMTSEQVINKKHFITTIFFSLTFNRNYKCRVTEVTLKFLDHLEFLKQYP